MGNLTKPGSPLGPSARTSKPSALKSCGRTNNLPSVQPMRGMTCPVANPAVASSSRTTFSPACICACRFLTAGSPTFTATAALPCAAAKQRMSINTRPPFSVKPLSIGQTSDDNAPSYKASAPAAFASAVVGVPVALTSPAPKRILAFLTVAWSSGRSLNSTTVGSGGSGSGGWRTVNATSSNHALPTP